MIPQLMITIKIDSNLYLYGEIGTAISIGGKSFGNFTSRLRAEIKQTAGAGVTALTRSCQRECCPMQEADHANT
jgi:hypothetical protein